MRLDGAFSLSAVQSRHFMHRHFSLGRDWEDIRFILIDHVIHLVVPLVLEVFEKLIPREVSLRIMKLFYLHGIDFLFEHLSRVKESFRTLIVLMVFSLRLGIMICDLCEIGLILRKI
jgi:hypothetical protein